MFNKDGIWYFKLQAGQGKYMTISTGINSSTRYITWADEDADIKKKVERALAEALSHVDTLKRQSERRTTKTQGDLSGTLNKVRMGSNNGSARGTRELEVRAFTIKEAARYLGIGKNTAYERLPYANGVKPIRQGRKILITKEDLDRLIDRAKKTGRYFD